MKELRSFPIRSPFCLFRYQTSTSQAFTSRKMILCGDLRFSYRQRHRYQPSREERDTTQHTAHARAGGFYR